MGIWKDLFFSQEDVSSEDYIFGIEELNSITYNKLIEIYPIDPSLPNGHRNNELLILEILILKRLLIEMSPSKTMTFGSSIDEDLKNFLDTFYYDYYVKNVLEPLTSDVSFDENILNNPIYPDISEEQSELMFDLCDEDCNEDDSLFNSASSNSTISMNGGTGPEYWDTGAKEGRKLLAKEAEDRIRARQEQNQNQNQLTTIEEQKEESKNSDIHIIEPQKPIAMPVLFNKLKKMYQNNMFTINQLQKSQIPEIQLQGKTISNLYDLLKMNSVFIKKTGSEFKIPAPKYKFIINNAANVGSNINGSRMFILNSYKNKIDEIIQNIQQNVFVGGTLDQEKLQEYTNTITNNLESNYAKLKGDYIEPIKLLTSKKRTNEITIREYNELTEKKYQQKMFERTEIVPLENERFLLQKLQDNSEFYTDFKDNFNTWFNKSQPIFGLYRNLQRGIFCPTSSMMDAMDNCSLKYGSTETKEVGTSYSEIIYEGEGTKISFGGVVLNYNENIDGKNTLVAKIYYDFECNNPSLDIATISTLPIVVSESNDLKARVAYKGVINAIKEIYDQVQEETGNQPREGLDYIKQMWANVQYQHDKMGFNRLLGSTALKTMGDYLQECQACFKWGGYVNTTELFPDIINRNKLFKKNIKPKLIYRSVSEGDKIIPYDMNGDALRLGIQGDRPSGFRSIYMLLNAVDGVNEDAITGYMFTSSTQNPSRTLLVSRNMGIENHMLVQK